MAVIELEDVEKRYVVRTRAGLLRRERQVVNAVSAVNLQVDQGEMVAYVGPNGAGKSSTIKMITGILQPDGGRIQVLGMEPMRQRVQLTRRLGVVFGTRSQLWIDLPLHDSFALLRHLYRVEEARFKRNLDELVDRLDLSTFLDRPVRQLSLGQRMRGELAAAFLHDPDLVLLDEPTVGLDVVAKYAVRSFLADINREYGTTVLLTTHDLDDVEQLCERLVIIDEGRVVLDGSLGEFKERFGFERIVVVDLDTAAEPLEIDGVEVVEHNGPRQHLRFDRRERSATDVLAAVAAQHPIRDVSIAEPTIEELIHRFYLE